MFLPCRWMSASLWVGALLLLAAWPAMAAPPQVQQIHKCRVAGVATFQRLPCADGQAEQAWEVDVVPAQRQHAARIEAIRRELKARERERVRRLQPPARHHRHRPPRARGPPGAVIGWAQQAQRCTQARQQRQVAYRKAGLQRSFALSRRMDDRVYAACR